MSHECAQSHKKNYVSNDMLVSHISHIADLRARINEQYSTPVSVSSQTSAAAAAAAAAAADSGEESGCFQLNSMEHEMALSVGDHDMIVFFGDLNYRIVESKSLEETYAMIRAEKLAELREFDQLNIERREGR